MGYVYRDGSRLTPWMLHCITQANAAFKAQFGLELLVTSGIRTNAEQEKIFRDRYTLTPGSRRVYDKRYWNGKWWYRVSPVGTVAQPGTSNHEIQGTRAAVDLRDTGKDAGVMTAGTVRANWLRANAPRFGLVASGYGFGEPWHYDIPNINQSVPGGPTSTGGTFARPSEEDDMKIIVQRSNSNLPKGEMTHNRKMREITKWENIAYRKAQADGAPIFYVTVTDQEYANLLAGKD